ncbi:hypothetical protein HAZT_HAZT009060 [Hyalella azteca]|uniref:Protein zer-1 homolog-like C-terminal domain-containing protein n=1 Tax=Hyalella azteca TaxID=294128 RepID=A0A6A0GVQ8_HYAAZ|nr:hypothetical protein HAZT_HAZT009060 [Hyalella azteca]
MFNIPNYGRVYDKSNSTDPPSENAERLDLFERDFFHFQWRQPDVYLSPRTVAMFLEELDRCGMLNDSTLSLFDTPRMQLNEHLSLSGVMIHDTAITIDVLKTLTRLRFLDFSAVTTNHDVRHEECINEVLMSPHFAPDLEFIDVSNKVMVSEQVLFSFLSTHPNVKGVALVNVPVCPDFCTSEWPQVKFLTGVRCIGSDESVLDLDRLTECMQHYRRRHILAQQMLTFVSAATHESSPSKPHPKLVASILQFMEDFQSREYDQTLSIICLYNLTVGSPGAALHPNLQRSVVHATMHAMTLHGDNHQLQKIGLLLCWHSVLHNVSCNQYWVAMKALHALHSFADDEVDHMAVGICYTLAAELTNEQTAQLGSNPAFMNKLLVLVRGRMQDNNADIMLQYTLSALMNLTDESPVTCEIFLNQDGLQIFINLLLTFPDKRSVEITVLKLFNNVAVVPELRKELLKPPFIAMLRRQLQSEHIAVSYFAAGISAYLLCAEQAAWLAADDLPYKEVLAELGDVVLGWECAPYVQLWALWALHHVTSNDSDYYCPMLIREGIPELLLTQRDDAPSSAPFLRDFALKLLALVAAYEMRDAKTLTGKNAPTFIPCSRS